ncbi:MAG: hypothetical protein NTY19_23675 [Planctomycetota bacterium]|nr:hypothetical protein [Planctomycetota bacterium]
MADRENQKHAPKSPPRRITAKPEQGELTLPAAQSIQAPRATVQRNVGGKAIAELRSEIERAHLACRESAASAVLHAIEAGKYLNAAKSLVAPGQFGAWLRENFTEATGLTERTAQRYMLLDRSSRPLLEEARRELASTDPTRVSDLSDHDLLNTYTMTRALKVIAAAETQVKPDITRDSARVTVARHNEWLTPPEIVAAASQFLDTIDIDPCAANNHTDIPAAVRFTAEDDGLADGRVWKGKAFINPGQHGDLRSLISVRSCRANEPEVVLLPHPVMIVALAPSDRNSDFAAAFAAFGDVFVPYVPT